MAAEMISFAYLYGLCTVCAAPRRRVTEVTGIRGWVGVIGVEELGLGWTGGRDYPNQAESSSHLLLIDIQ